MYVYIYIYIFFCRSSRIVFATMPASPKCQDVKEHMVQVTQQLNTLQQNVEDPLDTTLPSESVVRAPVSTSAAYWTESGQIDSGRGRYWKHVQTSKPVPICEMRS